MARFLASLAALVGVQGLCRDDGRHMKVQGSVKEVETYVWQWWFGGILEALTLGIVMEVGGTETW